MFARRLRGTARHGMRIARSGVSGDVEATGAMRAAGRA
ncbi:hypothetical protein BCEP27_21181 [Burkholderia cepacia]